MIRVLKYDDLRKESLINKKWSFSKSVPSAYPDGILITGANSFVGTHVISKLQNRWQGPVHLLIRAATTKEAIDKMSHAFTTWELGTFQSENFSIHLGDVSLNMMGIDARTYSGLKKNVGFVLHMAMNPLYYLPYAHFKRLWLPELEKMIAFCGDKSYPKSLHYPSSYNANFFTTDSNFKQLNNNAWQSGYAGFKWVAGKAIQNAFRQNLKGCLYDIPVVLGTEERGLCPAHYAIWHILDMFLKTGYCIDFEFKIIPADVLSEIIVFNLLSDRLNNSELFIRPVLDEPVTHLHFRNTVANILGLKHTNAKTLRDACQNKKKFDFMFPPGYYRLLGKVKALPAILPSNFNKQNMPSTPVVFLSNLNRMLSQTRNLNPFQ